VATRPCTAACYFRNKFLRMAKERLCVPPFTTNKQVLNKLELLIFILKFRRMLILGLSRLDMLKQISLLLLYKDIKYH